MNVGIHSFLCGETFHTKKTAKNCLIKNFLCKTFCIGEKIQVAKTKTFERCMNLKPQNTKVHLFKFVVNCFFSHFYQVCISKRFFHSQSSHFTFGSDCTVPLLQFFAMFAMTTMADACTLTPYPRLQTCNKNERLPGRSGQVGFEKNAY